MRWWAVAAAAALSLTAAGAAVAVQSSGQTELVGAPAFSWQPCSGKHSDRFSIKNLTLTPAPVPYNTSTNVTFLLEGVMNGTDSVVNGSMEISLTFAGAYVYHSTLKLCDVVKCPLKPGAMHINSSTPFPALPYLGTLGGQCVAIDQSGNEVACVAYSLAVKK
eukprot:TRINITY_DN9856_c1_g4_i1.p3 TRINITY_DN9856_c1_g4~~TRINITY_DN9856_c1_g4_i1.p3  ORF type:complete len:163 (+),score=29.13 TRINITY_DN9856_c1_g4_i1:108-596(+)